jgi:uroporphyrinogen-III synthase
VPSHEGLRNVLDTVERLGQAAAEQPAVVVNERAAALAQELGFKQPAVVARKASDEDIVEALRE